MYKGRERCHCRAEMLGERCDDGRRELLGGMQTQFCCQRGTLGDQCQGIRNRPFHRVAGAVVVTMPHDIQNDRQAMVLVTEQDQ